MPAKKNDKVVKHPSAPKKKAGRPNEQAAFRKMLRKALQSELSEAKTKELIQHGISEALEGKESLLMRLIDHAFGRPFQAHASVDTTPEQIGLVFDDPNDAEDDEE